MNKAIFLKKLDGWNGDARLYKLLPPLPETDYDGKVVKTHEHVVVSAVMAAFSGPETYIFGSDGDGTVRDYAELDGSFRGGLNHEEALRDAGYEVEHNAQGERPTK